jgi:crossover junction endodeoxyribonuclease RuvC
MVIEMADIRRIIGIDPGLIHTGWAVIESVGNERHYVASGVILPPKKEALPDRLSFIFKELGVIMDSYHPGECAIEITFVNQNPTTTLILGHARAAAILAVSTRGIPVFEYEPNKVKKAIAGAGHADKSQIDAMVRILLPAAKPSTPDESDAIAIALAHSNYARFGN